MERQLKEDMSDVLRILGGIQKSQNKCNEQLKVIIDGLMDHEPKVNLHKNIKVCNNEITDPLEGNGTEHKGGLDVDKMNKTFKNAFGI